MDQTVPKSDLSIWSVTYAHDGVPVLRWRGPCASQDDCLARSQAMPGTLLRLMSALGHHPRGRIVLTKAAHSNGYVLTGPNHSMPEWTVSHTFLRHFAISPRRHDPERNAIDFQALFAPVAAAGARAAGLGGCDVEIGAFATDSAQEIASGAGPGTSLELTCVRMGPGGIGNPQLPAPFHAALACAALAARLARGEGLPDGQAVAATLRASPSATLRAAEVALSPAADLAAVRQAMAWMSRNGLGPEAKALSDAIKGRMR